MIKQDFSHLFAEPELKTFKANINIRIKSATLDVAKETLELLVKHFDRFDDVDVTGSFLNGVGVEDDA